jgi:putative hemolysin
MGSSGDVFHASWVWVAILCGILYLIFDAGRYFAQQLSPVRMRRLTGDQAAERNGAGWRRYDAENFQLVSGALLQIALIIAFGATILATGTHAVGAAFVRSFAIWASIILVWKFILRLIPDEAAEVAFRGLIPISHFFYVLFWPVLFPLRRVMDRFEADAIAAEEAEEVTDEEVQAYIDVGEEEGILEGGEGRLLQSIVDFGDRVARELMTPRIDVLAFDARRPIAELAALFSESKYSRIPIYTENIDKITGIVHIKEIFDAILKGETRSISELARPPYFVSETKKVSELLREFQSEHLQVAIVVDEYGGTAGIISIEDIVEEIVGEIADEHEDEESTVVDMGDGMYLVSGLVRVDTLEELLDANLSGDDYETVAGLIFTTLGRVPAAGSVVSKNGYRFEVDRADRRRIYRVKVSKEPEPPPEEI